MKFSCSRDALLSSLQAVIGVVERRQTLPILSNVLVETGDGQIVLTATDLEVQLQAAAEVKVGSAGRAAVPARKLLDICKALPEGSQLEFKLAKDKATLKAGRSRFSLAVLPADDFPVVEDPEGANELTLSEVVLKGLIDHTQFAMAQQDVRYYLNGLMLEFSGRRLLSVATDGHRLALSEAEVELDLPEVQQIIVPRKGVIELSRLLQNSDEPVQVRVSKNHIQVVFAGIAFISKLVDGRFPDYQRVIPKDSSNDLNADRNLLRDALSRTAILSNEKYRGVRLHLSNGALRIVANNPDQEEAEEELEVDYEGDELEIGFNVRYLIDALSAIEAGDVQIELKDPNSSCLIHAADSDRSKYVVMPMRL